MPEGTPVFANEPILEVVAPIGQCQLIETLVLNQIGFQTLIASKAARVVAAAGGRTVVDFGGRRAHGMDAAVEGARAAYVAGVAATSNVEAGQIYGIPVTGTVAHSFVQAFPSEMEAFRTFAARFPQTTLLVDTYDTLAGVEKVIALARELGPAFAVQAVRLDSGDLAALARGARALLDAAGLAQVRILASGGLDEWKIAAMVDAGVPIDGFGVGTDMSVSGDAPALDIAYKLTEYAGRGRMKLSTGKHSLPGRKQVFRTIRDGATTSDVIARHGETLEGRPLLQPVMAAGHRLVPSPTLDTIRAHAAAECAALPAHLCAWSLQTRPIRSRSARRWQPTRPRSAARSRPDRWTDVARGGQSRLPAHRVSSQARLTSRKAMAVGACLDRTSSGRALVDPVVRFIGSGQSPE